MLSNIESFPNIAQAYFTSSHSASLYAIGQRFSNYGSRPKVGSRAGDGGVARSQFGKEKKDVCLTWIEFYTRWSCVYSSCLALQLKGLQSVL